MSLFSVLFIVGVLDANDAADATGNKDRRFLLFLHLPVFDNGDWSNDIIAVVKEEVVGVGGRLHNIILLVDVDCDDGGGGAGTLWTTTTNPSTARIIATVTTMIMGVVMVVATAIVLLVPDLRPERHAISTHIDIDDDGPSALLFTAGITARSVEISYVW